MISTINNSNEYDIYKERDISTNDDLYFLSKYSDFDDNSEIIPFLSIPLTSYLSSTSIT